MDPRLSAIARHQPRRFLGAVLQRQVQGAASDPFAGSRVEFQAPPAGVVGSLEIIHQPQVGEHEPRGSGLVRGSTLRGPFRGGGRKLDRIDGLQHRGCVLCLGEVEEGPVEVQFLLPIPPGAERRNHRPNFRLLTVGGEQPHAQTDFRRGALHGLHDDCQAAVLRDHVHRSRELDGEELRRGFVVGPGRSRHLDGHFLNVTGKCDGGRWRRCGLLLLHGMLRRQGKALELELLHRIPVGGAESRQAGSENQYVKGRLKPPGRDSGLRFGGL